jgi:heme exporter protein D
VWHDEGVWIALGMSALFVIAGVVMHRVFVRILKTGADAPDRENQHE